MSKRLDIFGGSHKRAARSQPQEQLDLFTGWAPWLAWARQTFEVQEWRINQRVRIGGVWYAVEWDSDTNEWVRRDLCND